LLKEIKSALVQLSDDLFDKNLETKKTAAQTSTTRKDDKDWIKIVEDAQRSHLQLMKELNSFDKEDLEPEHVVTTSIQDLTDLQVAIANTNLHSGNPILFTSKTSTNSSTSEYRVWEASGLD
jgi:predicted DNA binding protein